MTTTRDGITFRVKCRPGAPTTRLKGVHDGALKMDVGAPPENGKANDALLRWLAKCMGHPTASFALSSGAGSKEKSIRVLGITKDDAERRFRALLEDLGESK